MAHSPTSASTPGFVKNDKADGVITVEKNEQNVPENQAWAPTVFQSRPIAGLTAICVVFGCTLASLAILLISDRQPTQDWPIQPTVYLAIVTACANAALAFAWLEAGPVHWWHAALQGRTVRSLERRWQVSRSVVQALFHARNLRLLNVACFAVAFVIVDGPLLQRASSVIRATQSSDITLDIRLPPELPTGFTGLSTGSYLSESHAMTYLFRDHIRNVPMYLEMDHSCTDVCYARVQGPGVAKTNCVETVWPITPEMLHSPNATWAGGQTVTTNYYGNKVGLLPIFYIVLLPSYGHASGEAASLTVGIADWVEDSGGNFTETNCFLLPALVEYNVSMTGSVVSVDSQNSEPRVVSLANNTYAPGLPGSAGQQRWDTMDGITVATGLLVNANASAEWDHGRPDASTQWLWSPTNTDAQSYTYFKIHNSSADAKVYNGTAFSDPTSDVINSFSQLMFRGATMVASGWTSSQFPHLDSLLDPGVRANQTVSAEEQVTRNVFRSELGWYAGAAAFELITAFLILPFYWGFWRFGCNLSMSPFSMALAFDSPLVQDVNSASGGKGVVECLGESRLRFGVLKSRGGATSAVDLVEEDASTSRRLGFGKDEDVVRPQKGVSLS